MLLTLLHALRTLEQEGICYCLLRDGDRLDSLTDASEAEVDLLVQAAKLRQLRATLVRLGFVDLPVWGYQPHHFFVYYDQRTNGWLKLDVVTELAFGSPIRAMVVPIADDCLNRRRRHAEVFVPGPEDELTNLLLHGVLDKRAFAQFRRDRLQTLSRETLDDEYLSTLLHSYWLPGTSWPDMARHIDDGDWDWLLAQRKHVAAYLRSQNRMATFWRTARNHTMRKLGCWQNVFRPSTPLVAVVAPDGAGKSSLIEAIKDSFCFSTKSVYMGLYPGGRSARRRLSIPGVGLAGHLLKQWRQYLTARYHQARGRLVLFDRYTYDAMLVPRDRLGWLRRWRLSLLAHACPAPDMVVMLDAPGELLFARKGEHSPDVLEQQRQAYLALHSQLPQMVVVDATGDLQSVSRDVTAAIWQGCAKRLVRRRRR